MLLVTNVSFEVFVISTMTVAIKLFSRSWYLIILQFGYGTLMVLCVAKELQIIKK